MTPRPDRARRKSAAPAAEAAREGRPPGPGGDGAASPFPGRPDRWDLAAGGAVFALALAARLVYIHQLHAAGLARFLRLDPLYYHQWALKIAGGDWLGREVFEMSPLYAYLLGAIYSVAGEGPLLPRLLQALIGAAVCGALVVAGRRAFGKAEGLLAGGIFALYGPAIFYDGQIMKTSLEISLTAFMTFAFHAAARPGPSLAPRWVFAGGLLLGATALMRENILVAAPLFFAWTLMPRPGVAGRARLAAAAALVAGTILPIAPATIRNLAVARELVLITSLGGENFYTGNNEQASGRYTPPPFVRPDPQYEHEDFRREAARRAGRPLSRKEASRFWYDEGLRFVREKPGRFVALLADKLDVFWNDFERPDNYSFENFRRFSSLLAAPLPRWSWIAPLGLVGIALSWRRWRDLLPFLITLAAFLLSALIFFTQSRYRIPAAPLLALFAAHAAVVLGREIRSRKYRTAAWALPVAAGLFLVVTRDPGNTPGFAAQNRVLVAEMYLEAGRIPEAAAEYRAAISAVAALPAAESLPARRVEANAHLGLARTLLRSGDAAAAVEELRLAARSPREDVRFAAWQMLGIVLGERGDAEGAAEALARSAAERPGDFDARMLLAEALARAGRLEEALGEIEACLRIRPGDPEASRARAALASALGR